MRDPINVDDFRVLARRRLPKLVFDYLDGGAEDETGLARNRDAFCHVRFVPRRLVDVSRRTLATTLFERPLDAPFMIAPTGLNGLLWPRGDIALARAARAAGIPFVLSTASNVTLEALAEKAGGDLWFQLYVLHAAAAENLVARASRAGYRTLVLTTDVALNGKRERDLRNGFGVPMRFGARTLLDGLTHPRWSAGLLRHGMPRLENFATDTIDDPQLQAALLRREMDASFDWEALRRLRDRWPHRLVVKGLLHEADVTRCAALGIDGVVLSNHGGRQLDAAIAPLGALARLARPACATLLDGGVRRGSDIATALALGADAVLVGRAVLYGLAAAGEDGASEVIRLLKDELDRTLALLGCASVAALGRDLLDGAPREPDQVRREAAAATGQRIDAP